MIEAISISHYCILSFPYLKAWIIPLLLLRKNNELNFFYIICIKYEYNKKKANHKGTPIYSTGFNIERSWNVWLNTYIIPPHFLWSLLNYAIAVFFLFLFSIIVFTLKLYVTVHYEVNQKFGQKMESLEEGGGKKGHI